MSRPRNLAYVKTRLTSWLPCIVGGSAESTHHRHHHQVSQNKLGAKDDDSSKYRQFTKDNHLLEHGGVTADSSSRAKLRSGRSRNCETVPGETAVGRSDCPGAVCCSLHLAGEIGRRVPGYLGTRVLGGAGGRKEKKKWKSRAGGRCRTRLLLQVSRYRLQEPAPRCYSTRSNLVLVEEDFFCKFLPHLIKPGVPCTAELFLLTILFCFG